MQQPRPVELLGARAHDVGNVGAVVPLALHHERLRPDHLLGRDQADGHVEDPLLHAVLKPQVVDEGHPVTGAEDQVDHLVAAPGLAQPVREAQIGVAAGGAQGLEGRLHVAGMDEQIEVLGVPADARVTLERIGAANQERHAPGLEPGHHIAIERARDGIEHAGSGTHRAAPAGTGVSVDTGISSNRNGGRSGNSRFNTGRATLYTGTPVVVRPSGAPPCEWP